MEKKTTRGQPSRRRQATPQVAESQGLEQLREQHRLLGAIVETSPAAIVAINSDGEIFLANAAAEGLLGMSASKATERAYNAPEWRITGFGGEPFPEDELPFSRVKGSLAPVRDVRHAIEWPDGKKVYLSINAAPILGTEGELVGVVAALEELTEHQRLRQTPEESEQLVNAVLRSAPFGAHLYELEDDGRLIFTGANPAASRILGVDCSSFVGRTIEEAFPALRDTEIPAAYRRAAADGEDFQVDELVYDSEGVAGAYEVHAFQTGPGTMAAFFLDITQRKLAEEVARIRQAKLESLFSTTPVGLCVSVRRIITEVNPALCEIVGYPAEELIGMSIGDLYLSDEDLEQAAEELRSKERIGGTGSAESRYRRKDGGVRDVFITSAPLDAADRSAGAMFGVVDITEQKRTQEALRESEERYRRLVDNAPDLIFRIKLKPEVEFEYVSPAVEEIGGYTPDELYADPGLLWRVVEPEDAEKIERIMQSTGTSTETVRWRHKDGHLYWTETRHVPIRDESGELVALEGIIRDITEQRLAEAERELLQAQLLRAQKMEAIGTLAGGVAHNFNNLLTGIIGYTELALMRLPENTPARSDLEEIKRAAARASDVVRGLLAFSRRESAHAEAIDLNSIVGELEALLRQLIGANIEIETRLASELGPVEIDRSQIEQAIVNLVVNARDAMPGGGKLVIETARRELAEPFVERDVSVAPGRYVVLSVSDTGIGMDEETIGRIFEPFFSTKGPVGTGLGLSTVFGIVEAAGGKLIVKSRPGQGAIFTIFLPALGGDDAESSRRASAGGTPE